MNKKKLDAVDDIVVRVRKLRKRCVLGLPLSKDAHRLLVIFHTPSLFNLLVERVYDERESA